VCVISAGFHEAGEEGKKRGQALLETVREHGMRMIGPNCMGLSNATSDVRLNATFSHVFPPAGRVGMLSQSGALGLAVLDHAEELGLGLSTFVSVGNKLDVTASDLIQYWEDDPDTDVLLLYLESFDDAGELRRHATRIARKKPIVVVKSGRTAAGERAASSHTAAVSGQDKVADAFLAQSGAIRVETLREMFGTLELLVDQGRPRGSRVGIVTNGGGPGILAADACPGNGLEVPTLGESTQAQLREILPAAAAVANPVDLLAGADAETYERALRIVGESGDVDILLTIFIPPIVIEAREVAEAMARARRELDPEIPVVAVFMGRERRPEPLVESGIPSYSFPEEAARALGHLAHWAQWCRKPPEDPIRPDGIDADRGREIIRRARSRGLEGEDGSVWMSTGEAMDLLDAYGVGFASSRIVSEAEGAADAQREIGGPVAVKVDAPIHKADVGGVVLGCETPEEAAEAVHRIRRALEEAGEERYGRTLVVQAMVEEGVQLAAGLRRDPVFGPVSMIGLGGELLELMDDVAVRLPPLTEREAREMVESLKAYPLLDGYRGQPARDVGALLDLIHRLGALAMDVGALLELDLNPVFVGKKGVLAADVRLRLASEES
ncbi:MAG: acetate--CoA ligase family protein, partial [bacterium]